MEKPLFSIRQVIALTGVSEYVLRAWELRYGAFKPKRTQTGRRLYSKDDLEKARALWELTQNGFRISEVAPLTFKELENKLAKKKELNKSVTSPKADLIQKILNCSQTFNWEECRKILLTERKKHSTSQYIYDVILPLIQGMNELVSKQNMTIAQEHILSSFIKENLGALNADKLPKNHSIRIVFASPEGDSHEIGLLIALALTRSLGFSTLYLGANTPKKDLCDSALRFQATHLLISSTLSLREGAKEDPLHYLHFLDQHLPSKVKFLVAGRGTATAKFELKRHFEKLENFQQFERLLKALKNS